MKLRTWFRKLLYVDMHLLAVGNVIFVVVLLTGAGLTYRNYMDSRINPAVYTPLLNTIAKGESGGNYNAYFGNAGNTAIRFTDMSISEVLLWQADYVKKGSPSSAVGKYQIIRPTLAELTHRLNISPNTKFDAKLQDKLAVALLEKRGARQFIKKQLTREQFAANLAEEWAALPRATGANPTVSYYAGDGINAAHISLDEIYKALGALHT